MKTPVWCLTLCILGSALAQDVPPPPKPADNGPSLAETMAYIQDKLNMHGKVEYQATYQAPMGTTTFSVEVYGAEANASRCTLSWTALNLTATPGLRTKDRVTFQFSFRDVDHFEVSALSAQKPSDPDPRPGAGTVVIPLSFSPDVYNVRAVMAAGKKFHMNVHNDADGVAHNIRPGEFDVPPIRDHYLDFLFRDNESANRMAKAMVHAVELCGGGDKDPFK